MNLLPPADIVKSDLDIAQNHIELLTGDPNSFWHFRLIHDVRKEARSLAGTVEDLWPEFEQAQSEGYGVFVVVNAGGHSDDEIESIRAVFIDGDNQSLPAPCDWHGDILHPTFIVVRDETHFHAYWRVDDLPVDAFKALQLRLAAHYGSDAKVSNPSRVMRLAGTLHLKDPSTPRLLTIKPDMMHTWGTVYEAREVLAGLPTVPVKLAEPRGAAPGVTLDFPANVQRYGSYLQGLVARGEVAVEGQKGDAHTLQVANKGLDLGCSPPKTHELMLAHFNNHCVPPWDADELAVKVSNAASFRKNAIGCDAVKPSAEEFKGLVANTANAQPAAKVSRFRPIPENEMDTLPEPVWLIDDIVEDRTTCIFVGESGSFKTFIVADICFAVATGKKTAFGTMPRRTGPVFYGALEGLGNVLKERRTAWRQSHDVDGTFPFFGMIAPSLWDPGQWAEFVEQIDATGQRPALIALETFTRMADGKENDAEAGATLAKLCYGLIARYDCSVIVVHHNSDKDGASKTGRGTSSLKGNCDSMILVEGDRHTRTADVSVLKHRTFAQPDKPWHLQGRPRGPALVFGLITPDEVRAAKLQRDPYHPSHVIAALKRLGAVGPDKAVATAILASEFVPTEGYETQAERDAAIKTATNRLNEKAKLPNTDKKGLWAFADISSGKWMWSIPE